MSESRNHTKAAQLSAAIIITGARPASAILRPRNKYGLCIVCRERHALFPICRDNGNRLNNPGGYCGECKPAQEPEEVNSFEAGQPVTLERALQIANEYEDWMDRCEDQLNEMIADRAEAENELDQLTMLLDRRDRESSQMTEADIREGIQKAEDLIEDLAFGIRHQPRRMAPPARN